MVVPFILVPKIWINNKRDNFRQGRGQADLQEYLQEPGYTKQKETEHKGKHTTGCYPKPIKLDQLGINKNIPNSLK